MHKNEFELKKLGLEAEKFGSVMNLIQHVISMGTVLGSIYLIVSGLQGMVESQPDALRALAVVIEKLQVNSILGYVVAGCTTLGYVYERRGKKRAIRKLDQFRSTSEGGDPYRGSSNLDENGHTPK